MQSRFTGSHRAFTSVPWVNQLTCTVQELNSYLALETQTSMIVDRSAQGELLRINFNISFPALSCEFATLDVSDALGTVRCQFQAIAAGLVKSLFIRCKWLTQEVDDLQKRLNLTRTVRKLPINEQLERVGHYIHDDRQLQIKYDELPEVKFDLFVALSMPSVVHNEANAPSFGTLC